jgi:hypothetical protein
MRADRSGPKRRPQGLPAGSLYSGANVHLRHVVDDARPIRAEGGEHDGRRMTAQDCDLLAPLAASQMRAVLSPEAVTMRVPSGLKAADNTKSSCPLNDRRHADCWSALANSVEWHKPQLIHCAL